MSSWTKKIIKIMQYWIWFPANGSILPMQYGSNWCCTSIVHTSLLNSNFAKKMFFNKKLQGKWSRFSTWNPGKSGITTITLKHFFSLSASIIRLYNASKTRFRITSSPERPDIKNWFWSKANYKTRIIKQSISNM